MATTGYIKINYADPSELNGEGGFLVQPYAENGPRHPSSTMPSLGNNYGIDTSLTYYGKGARNYGEKYNEDFLNLLENFASPLAPSNPTNGQIWYDTGRAYTIISFNLSNTVTISGDHTAEIQNMITDYGILDNSLTTFRFVSVDSTTGAQAVLGIRPLSGTLVGPDTQIVVEFTPFTAGAPVNGCYLFTAINRSVLRIYNKPTSSWTVANGAHVGIEAPQDPTAGELWLDTSTPPSNLRCFDGSSWSSGYLTISGGTLTGPLLLAGDPTVALEAAPKQYVDSLIDTVVGAGVGSPPTSLTILDSRVDAIDSSLITIIGALSPPTGLVGLDARVDELEANIGIGTGKVDRIGDTMSGSLNFEIPELGTSAGITLTGIDGIVGRNFTITAEGSQSTTFDLETRASIKMSAPIGDILTAVAVVYSEIGGVDTTVVDIRPDCSLTKNGVYEQDPALLALGGTPNPLLKYLTKFEVDAEFNNRGATITNLSFNSVNKIISYDITDLGSNITTSNTLNIDHSHNNTVYNLLPNDIEFEQLHTVRTYPLNQLAISEAIHSLDEIKVGRNDPVLFEDALDYAVIVPSDVNTVSDIIRIPHADISRLAITAGDSWILRQAGTAGTNVVDYPTHPSFSGATLLDWVYQPASPPELLTATIIIDDNQTETSLVVIDPSTVLTVSQLVSSISAQLNNPLNEFPVPDPIVNITIVGTSIYFESTLIGGASSVEILDNTLFNNAFATSSPAIPAIIGVGIGGSAESTESQVTIGSVDASHTPVLGFQQISGPPTDRITRSVGSWITDGVLAGDTIVIANADDVSNNGTYTINTVNTLYLVVDEAVPFDDGSDPTATFIVYRGLTVITQSNHEVTVTPSLSGLTVDSVWAPNITANPAALVTKKQMDAAVSAVSLVGNVAGMYRGTVDWTVLNTPDWDWTAPVGWTLSKTGTNPSEFCRVTHNLGTADYVVMVTPQASGTAAYAINIPAQAANYFDVNFELNTGAVASSNVSFTFLLAI